MVDKKDKGFPGIIHQKRIKFGRCPKTSWQRARKNQVKPAMSRKALEVLIKEKITPNCQISEAGKIVSYIIKRLYIPGQKF
ncbi:hypothetical protein JXA84_02335 [candidate division WOR-3 bacterium]|nr:hypothetical protein [candidate division WOR-3 bacterium]